MATLKDIDLKRKSIRNIAKITSSMKMVSAAKFARAEKALKAARCLGPASNAILVKNEISTTETPEENTLYITATSDRGLCGGIHSGIGRYLRPKFAEEQGEYKIATIGDKTRGLFQRNYGDQFLTGASEVGRLPVQFGESAFIAGEIINSGYDYTNLSITYNHFKNAASYTATQRPVISYNQAAKAQEAQLSVYDDVGEDNLRAFCEFNLASNIHYALIENASSEQSARMTAMENATKNANEMEDKLNILFNRSRQAVITTELIEIISGASAME
jgi:F-type H+-transporting ATPase subunit gamma